MIASSVFGSLVGFAASAIAPISDYFKEKEITRRDIGKLEKTALLAEKGFSQEQTMAVLTQTTEEHARLLKHDIEISKQEPGFISGVQRSVRPVITYAFFALFSAVEISILMQAMNSGLPWEEALTHIWDEETNALFATVLSFWFGDRVFEKRKGKR